MSELDLLKIYREFLRDYIRLSKENPSFESDSKWKLYTEGNCYCYALMLPTPKVFVRAYYSKSTHEFPHDVGFLSGKEYSDDIDICYDNLRSDLDLEDRIVQSIILSQYRLKLFSKHGLNIKPVILFKSSELISKLAVISSP